MNRFFGMMPSSEVEKEKTYKDSVGMNIKIQAGPKGWTILYADSSSEYRDVEASTEENFEEALKTLKGNFSELTEA